MSRMNRRHEVSVISAPVYDHHRRQVMVFSLTTGRVLSAAELTRYTRAAMATADSITAQLGRAKPRWRPTQPE